MQELHVVGFGAEAHAALYAESLNPRVCRIVALGTPTEREKNKMVFPALRRAPPATLRARSGDAATAGRSRSLGLIFGFSRACHRPRLRLNPDFWRLLTGDGCRSVCTVPGLPLGGLTPFGALQSEP